MFIWQPASNGEIARVPGRRPLVHPDLQNNTSTKNKALALFMLGFVILAPLLITFSKLSQNNLP